MVCHRIRPLTTPVPGRISTSVILHSSPSRESSGGCQLRSSHGQRNRGFRRGGSVLPFGDMQPDLPSDTQGADSDTTRLETPQKMNPEKTRGRAWLPGFLTTISAVIVVGAAGFLVANIVWVHRDLMSSSPQDPGICVDDDSCRVQTYRMLLAITHRSIGLLCGYSLVLLGTSVAAYQFHFTPRSKDDKQAATSVYALQAMRAAPAILAILVGFVISLAVVVKDIPTDQIAESSSSSDTVYIGDKFGSVASETIERNPNSVP